MLICVAHVSGNTHVIYCEKTCGAESVTAALSATTLCRDYCPTRRASDRWIGRHLVFSSVAKIDAFSQEVNETTVPSECLEAHRRGTCFRQA